MITRERLKISIIAVSTHELIPTQEIYIGTKMKIYRETLKIDFSIHTGTHHLDQGSP